VNTNLFGFDFESVHYYYAIVPVNEFGIMGNPAIAEGWITPDPSPPTIILTTKMLAPGEWDVILRASQPLLETPHLKAFTPDGRQISVKFSTSPSGSKTWYGKLFVDFFPPTGNYTYVASVRGRAGNTGTFIAEGGQFEYSGDAGKDDLICYPNPFNPSRDKVLKFRPPGFNIKIYDISGEFIKELSGSEWDGTNGDDQRVSSGIYIYLAEGDGMEKTGKVAVIW
jgi:hypothetical protein